MLKYIACSNGLFIIELILKGENGEMLKENIKTLRKQKGLSQEELSVKLNVVRQTISKWEQGLSVPDAEMLISISKVFDTPVSTLLGENISESKASDLKIISEKLEIINLQLLQRKNSRQKIIHWLLILMCVSIIITFIVLILLNSPYLDWNYSNPEKAFLGINIHIFEWLFIRIAPVIFIGSIIGIFLTRKRN